jgi:hypothetical protein
MIVGAEYGRQIASNVSLYGHEGARAVMCNFENGIQWPRKFNLESGALRCRASVSWRASEAIEICEERQRYNEDFRGNVLLCSRMRA